MTDVSPDGSVDPSAKGRIEDLEGHLLLPPLIEHHAHIDKALTADLVVNRTGDLMGAIEAWIEAENAGVLGFEDMQMRAEKSLEQLALAGVSRVRTHVNVGASDSEQRNLRAVAAARRNFADLIDVEIVALMHSPLSGEDGRANRLALDKALEFGVDLIGGCPHLEEDSVGMIDHVLAVARSSRLPLDLHVDETLDPQMLTVELLARAILDGDFDLGVTASHCVSLSMQDVADQVRLAGLLRQSGIRVVALPQTNLFLQGWGQPVATPRGITPMALLQDHGVDVVAGGDNVQDPFNPMGRNDPLETASLLVTAAHVDPEAAFAAVSHIDPSTLSLFGTDVIGRTADFLSIDVGNIREAVATGSSNRRTIRRGRVVARSSLQRHLTRQQ